MKKFVSFVVVCSFILFSASCVIVKPKPRYKKVKSVKTGEGWTVLKKTGRPVKIKAWRNPNKKGPKPFRIIKPGVKVKVLKRRGSMALVKFENGDTGWIKAVYVK